MKSSVHLISNNSFLDSLYELNLRAYVGVDLIIHSNNESFIAESKKTYMTSRIFLISQDKVLTNLDTIKSLSNSELNKIFIIGERVPNAEKIDLDEDKVRVLKNKYDLRELVRSIAKELSITAQDMMKLDVPEYYPVSNKIFKFLRKLSVNLYSKENNVFNVVVEANEDIGESLDFIEDDFFYVLAKERLKFISSTSVLIVEELRNEELTTYEKIELSSFGAKFIADQISENEEITTELAEISNLCVKAFAQVSSGVPKAKNLIATLLENKEGFLYSHSVLSTYVAREIISKMTWGSKEQQDKVAFVLFFHDLFLVPIFTKYDTVDEESLLFRDDVSDEDKEIIFDHAYLVSNFIKSYPRAPIGADTLLAQHHGSTSGKGFPGIFGEDISPLAKVILISHDVAKHIFENILNKDKEKAFDKALIMKNLKEKFPRNTYKRIIDVLAEVEL